MTELDKSDLFKKDYHCLKGQIDGLFLYYRIVNSNILW